MPNYPLIVGYSPGWIQTGTNTRFYPMTGDCDFTATENRVQCLARDSYTLANLYLRLTQNLCAGISTIKSRVGGADGNQVASIGAGVTGVFQDAVNSDALVSGNLFDTSLYVNGTSVKVSIIAYTLTTPSNTTPILGSSYALGTTVNAGLTRYYGLYGISTVGATESLVQYTFRCASTLSNFRVRVMTNNCNGNSVFRVRKNGANGNQFLTVGAGATGSFEDAVNTDVVAIGNTINLLLDTTASGSGSITFTYSQVKSNSDGQQVAQLSEQKRTLGNGDTRYWVLQGSTADTGTELFTQLAAQATLIGRNLYVNIESNSMTSDTTVRTRINGGNGNLIVTIGGGLTGVFEDLANTDNYVAANLINYRAFADWGSGTIGFNAIGIELNQPAPSGWTGKISGVTNPVKIMGVNVGNITKVKGVASA